jgi:hypothetical protein
MKIREAKVGHAIRGESSNTLTADHFDMEFKDHCLHLKRKVSNGRPDHIIVFPANLAYIIPEETKKEEPKKGAK